MFMSFAIAWSVAHSNEPLGTPTRHARGAALPALAATLAGLLVMVWLLVGATERVVARAAAQSAADAAALAGAIDGRTEAQRVAAANGATLLRFEQRGNEVELLVEREGVTALANAERHLQP